MSHSQVTCTSHTPIPISLVYLLPCFLYDIIKQQFGPTSFMTLITSQKRLPHDVTRFLSVLTRTNYQKIQLTLRNIRTYQEVIETLVISGDMKTLRSPSKHVQIRSILHSLVHVIFDVVVESPRMVDSVYWSCLGK